MSEEIIMLEEEISKTLKAIIKKGDFDLFVKCVNENSIQANSYFYAKRDKSCLLYATLCNKFTNRNFQGRIQIAQYLTEYGANLNETNPYKYPLICGFIDQIYYLTDTKAKVEVYMELIKLAVDLVRREEVDVNQMSSHGESLLDSAMRLYSVCLARPEWTFDGVLTLLSKKLVEELLARGAVIQRDNDAYSVTLKSFN